MVEGARVVEFASMVVDVAVVEVASSPPPGVQAAPRSAAVRRRKRVLRIPGMYWLRPAVQRSGGWPVDGLAFDEWTLHGVLHDGFVV